MIISFYSAGLHDVAAILGIIGALCTIFVILSFQKKNFEQLEVSNKLFGENLDLVKSLNYIVEQDTMNVVSANKAVLNKNENIIGKKCIEIFGAEHEICESCYLRKNDAKNVKDQTFRVIDTEKGFFVCKTRTVITNNKTYYVVSIRDNSFEKGLSNRLQRAELDFKQIIEAFPVAVAVTNLNQKVKIANIALLELFDSKDTDVLGRRINDVFNLQKLSEQQSYSKIIDLNKYLFVNKEGREIFLYKKKVSVELQGEEGYIESFIDITIIEQARKSEEEANKAKSEFLANMSHEIRTPLNGVIGMIEVLAESVHDKQQREQAAIIRKSANLLLSVINDILDFSKIEAGKMTLEEIPFSLQEELTFCVQSFAQKAKEKQIKIDINCSEHIPPKIIGDPFRLKQIITNLLSNAIKFTEEGRIVVSAELKETSADLTVLFKVEDTGVGISKEKLSSIFNSFFQADGSTTRKYGGTGLGTAISKQLVELMHGKIRADSPSKISENPKYPGSCFSFTAEFIDDHDFDKQIQYDAVKNKEDIAVLIVDKEHEKKNVLRDLFKRQNISHVLLNNSKDTVPYIENYLATETKPLCLFIEDSLYFEGFELAEEIDRKHLSDRILIAILSSNEKSGNYVHCKRLKVDRYFVKPYEQSEILGVINNFFPTLKLVEKSGVEIEQLDKNLSILVAEDNPINQRVATILFRKIGYEIDIANNGKIAIEKVENKPYDIIFMDFMMPEMDGIEATRNLRALGHKMPIIALTGKATDEDEKFANDSGMDGFLSKPVTISDIKNMLTKWFLKYKAH